MEDFSIQVAQAVRALREHLGQGQVEYAQALGIGYGTIQGYERKVPPKGWSLFPFLRLAIKVERLDLAKVFLDALVEDLGLPNLLLLMEMFNPESGRFEATWQAEERQGELNSTKDSDLGVQIGEDKAKPHDNLFGTGEIQQLPEYKRASELLSTILGSGDVELIASLLYNLESFGRLADFESEDQHGCADRDAKRLRVEALRHAGEFVARAREFTQRTRAALASASRTHRDAERELQIARGGKPSPGQPEESSGGGG